MAAKGKLEALPGDIADRARSVFAGIVNDFDQLVRRLGERIGDGSSGGRQELLKLIRALRKSLDLRLAALEKLVGGPGSKPVRKATAKAKPKTNAKAATRGASRSGRVVRKTPAREAARKSPASRRR